MKKYSVTFIDTSQPNFINNSISETFYDKGHALQCFKKFKRDIVEDFQRKYGPLTEKRWEVVNMNESHESYFKCKVTNSDIFSLVDINEINE